MKKNSNKIAWYGVIILVSCSVFFPIYYSLKNLIVTKTAYFYYHSPQMIIERPVQENDMIFCQIRQKMEVIRKKNFYFNLIATSLLMPKKLELTNNNNKNLRLLSAFAYKERLIINFSREFYTLDTQEERNVMTSLLLLFNTNAPEIKEIKIRVEGNDLHVLNGIFHYATLINVKKGEKNMPFTAILQQKKSKKRKISKIFGKILDKNIIITPC